MKNTAIILLLSILVFACSETKDKITTQDLEHNKMLEDPMTMDYYTALFDSGKIFSSIQVNRDAFNVIKQKNQGKICNAKKEDFKGDAKMELYANTICRLTTTQIAFFKKYPHLYEMSKKDKAKLNNLMKKKYKKADAINEYSGLERNFSNGINDETKAELIKLMTKGENADMELLENNLGLDAESLLSIASKYLDVTK